MSKESKNTNSKEKKKRSKRETYYIDPPIIEGNIQKLTVSKEEKEIRKSIALNLNNLLLNRNIDQEKFANKVNVSTGSISQYRQGTGEPKITNLVKIANGLNVSINYLIGKSDCPNYEFEDINNKIGLSQKAIEQLYKFQYNYFPFDEDIDITKAKKISQFYKLHFDILNLILEDSGGLFFLLDSMVKYKKDYEEFEQFKNNEKEKQKNELFEILINEKKEKLDFYRFKILENFLYFINRIIEEGADKK